VVGTADQRASFYMRDAFGFADLLQFPELLGMIVLEDGQVF
jgi:hypothetical protein